MRIKHAEGQTLLTLARLVIVAVACLCVGTVASWAEWSARAVSGAGDMVGDILSGDDGEDSRHEGEPTVLYYSQPEANGGQTRVYQVLYITGSEGAYGLTDAAGNRLLDDKYQGVVPLPNAYVLKENGQWRFYDCGDLSLLSDQGWDQVEVLRSESGSFVSDLLAVSRDGLFGAVDMRGNIVVEPGYDYFQLSSLQADWPLIRVRRDGRYGFINSAGQIVISLSYDYAALDSVTVYADENDAEGTDMPIVYVLSNDDWGAIYRLDDGSSSDVDWSVEPTGEVMAAWRQEI